MGTQASCVPDHTERIQQADQLWIKVYTCLCTMKHVIVKAAT